MEIRPVVSKLEVMASTLEAAKKDLYAAGGYELDALGEAVEIITEGKACIAALMVCVCVYKQMPAASDNPKQKQALIREYKTRLKKGEKGSMWAVLAKAVPGLLAKLV